jgi:hypothetical protein
MASTRAFLAERLESPSLRVDAMAEEGDTVFLRGSITGTADGQQRVASFFMQFMFAAGEVVELWSLLDVGAVTGTA